MRSLGLLGCAVVALGLVACANLGDIEPPRCGNGVIDDGEDCDPKFEQATCKPAGSVNECRLTCDPSILPTPQAPQGDCAPGRICGLDGACLTHSGTFLASASNEVRGDTVLGTADLDGDGAQDLIASATGSLSVLHVRSDGRLLEPIRFHPAGCLPVTGQLTAEPTVSARAPDDLAVGYGGLFVHRGDPERMYGPISYSPIAPASESSATIAILDALPPMEGPNGTMTHLGHEIVALTSTGLAALDEDTLQWGSPDDWDAGDIGPADRSVRVADMLAPSAMDGCDELLVRNANGREIDLYSPCGGDAEPSLGVQITALLGTIHLPSNCATDRGFAMALVNDDAHPDLVIASDCEAPSGGVPAQSHCGAGSAVPERGFGSLWVAYWDDGVVSGLEPGFTGRDPLEQSDPPDVAACTVSMLPNSDLQQILLSVAGALPEGLDVASSPLLLAADDFNRDGLPDFVLLDGSVAISVARTPSSPRIRDAGYFRMPYADSGVWSFAHVADFNGNGIPDVVAGSADRPDLVFLNGTPDGLLNELHLPLMGPPAHLTVGDFDGDLLPDVAFVEVGPPDVLSISFGQPFGAPTEPTRLGAFDGVTQLAAGNLSIGGLDGLDDLIVVSHPVDDPSGPSPIALLLGSSDRMPFSPFFFTRDRVDAAKDNGGELGGGGYAVDTGFWTSALAIGQLDGDAAHHPDVAVLTRPGRRDPDDGWEEYDSYHLWLFPMTGDGRIDRDQVTATGLDDALGPLAQSPLFDRALLGVVELPGAADGATSARSQVVILGTVAEEPDGLETMHGAILVGQVVDFEPVNPSSLKVFQPEPLLDAGELLFAGPGLFADEADGQPSFPWDAGGRLEVGDVTGDALPDVVVLAGWVDSSVPGDAMLRTKVVAFLGVPGPDLTPAVDWSNPIEISGGLPAAPAWSPSPSAADPTSFALWQADADVALEVVLLTRHGAYQIDVDPRTGALGAPVQLRDAGDSPLPGGTTLALGDFDGDRLGDLALVRPLGEATVYGALEVWLGQVKRR